MVPTFGIRLLFFSIFLVLTYTFNYDENANYMHALTTLLLSATVAAQAVITHPYADDVGVYSSTNENKFVTDVATHYQTKLYEKVRFEEELFAIPLKGKKLLAIGGHGTNQRIGLGADPYCNSCDERLYVDTSDGPQLEKWLSQLDEDATIFLNVCDAAKGENNVADVIKRAAGNRTVIAAKDLIVDTITTAEGKKTYYSIQVSYDPFDVKLHCMGAENGAIYFYNCAVRK